MLRDLFFIVIGMNIGVGISLVLFKGFREEFMEFFNIEISKIIEANKQEPYIADINTESLKYNPKYGDDRICKCGHVYYRHFDWADNYAAVGCKYCNCYEFIEKL